MSSFCAFHTLTYASNSNLNPEKARYLAQDMHRDRRTYRVSLIPNPKAFPAKTAESLLLLSHIKINYDHKGKTNLFFDGVFRT